ncbi:glycosyltransferase [Amnibacterium flavum]|uniref:glycosyltransferase n=1 Tax=Amnibacterium flavum TaxID=2173173 RepID=UPI0014022CB1|nr:glycosyltransferase [Amnibacterium flavum]
MARALLVCSGGGHLKQLSILAQRIGIPNDEQLWVTFDTGLSRSLLADREVIYARYAAPRDGVNIVRNAIQARKVLKGQSFDLAISTGASLAVSYLPLAARRGISSHYIESAARAAGPSVTGKIIARDRKVQTYTQYPAWSSDRWKYRGSIFDQYAAGDDIPDRPITRVVVTVGTTESYGFTRLFDSIVPLLSGREVLWQTGTTDMTPYGVTGRTTVPHAELDAAVAEADVVIAHAGTGAALTAIEHGKCPILVPRLSEHGEHIDDHQIQIAGELARRGLAISAAPDQIDEELLRAAARRTNRPETEPPRFVLDGPALDPVRV